MIYSHVIKLAVQPAARCNAIISQTRPEGGNTTLMTQWAETLPSRRESSSSNDYFTHVWGPSGALLVGQNKSDSSTSSTSSSEKLLGKHMVLREDGSIFADRAIPQDSLRTLVGSKRKGAIVKEAFQFRTWMEALSRSVPLTNEQQHHKISGKYEFYFRDYWNFEEAFSLEVMRGSIQALKLRGQRKRPTELIIDEKTGNCTMTDYYVFNGVIPMYIRWKGSLERDTITWTHTMLHKGWKRWWGTTVDRPPMAEKFRQQPWIVRLPADDDSSGDLIVLERTGSGRLVFARDTVLP
eukprot:CAMPEP_0119003740 /NCGR_PEP_ID=MMETSP1176-20130426/740_1 /TAXON_ID=265551 /ORGANISM="Synedropsis recta cf, Strain CCMP1620" /LENGTH=294 /DNA_ID=CAMNT_0006955365 /DNA_START=113 /DNA_END=997 /DNA_ORIENTATION=+